MASARSISSNFQDLHVLHVLGNIGKILKMAARRS